MLSTFPSISSGDLWPGNPSSLLDSGFPSWDYFEPSFLFDAHSHEPNTFFSSQPFQEPVFSNSDSHVSSPITPTLNPEFHEPTRIHNSGSSPNDEERKRKRTISNRESARRSRARKQMQQEQLSDLVAGLRVEKFGLLNRLSSAENVNRVLRRENEFLRSESLILRYRLQYIRQVLLLRQHHQHIFSSEISMAMH